LLKRFVVGRKGIGTILGAGYFIIIVLAIFNLIMWEVNQYDAYQQLVSQMNQVDQDRISENLQFLNPALTDFETLGSGKYSFSLALRNAGGITTNVARIYFCNCSDTSSKALTTIEKGTGGNNCFTNGFINPGEDNHKIFVVTTLDMYTASIRAEPFYIHVATERGRTFSSFYPIVQTLPPAGSVPYIDIGPLRFVFDYYSLNYTTINQQTPAAAWRIPSYTSGTYIMFFVKVINIDTMSNIKLLKYCVFDCIEMAATGASQKIASFYIVGKNSRYPPSQLYAYDETNNPQILPHAEKGVSGNPDKLYPQIIIFGCSEWGTNKAMYLFTGADKPYEYLVLMGFYYQFPANSSYTYGVTVPFVAIRVNTST